MPWFTQFFWRFIVLFVLMPTVYLVFGWYTAFASQPWSEWLLNKGSEFNLNWKQEIAVRIIYGVAISWILMISLGLTLLAKQMTVIFGSWFKSDTRAIISVLGWAFAVVIMIRWITFSVRILVMLSATILGRLELQEAGYNKWQIFIILATICFSGYGLGVLIHNFGNNSLPEQTSNIYDFLIH